MIATLSICQVPISPLGGSVVYIYQCPRLGLNWLPVSCQSHALPTELSWHHNFCMLLPSKNLYQPFQCFPYLNCLWQLIYDLRGDGPDECIWPTWWWPWPVYMTYLVMALTSPIWIRNDCRDLTVTNWWKAVHNRCCRKILKSTFKYI